MDRETNERLRKIDRMSYDRRIERAKQQAVKALEAGEYDNALLACAEAMALDRGRREAEFQHDMAEGRSNA